MGGGLPGASQSRIATPEAENEKEAAMLESFYNRKGGLPRFSREAYGASSLVGQNLSVLNHVDRVLRHLIQRGDCLSIRLIVTLGQD